MYGLGEICIMTKEQFMLTLFSEKYFDKVYAINVVT